MRRIILLILFICLSNVTFAGFNGLTWHSRANCINNESITWDWTTYRVTGTVSKHYKNGLFIHQISTGWQYTWRSAAVHWSEAAPGSGWSVKGYHWLVVNKQERMIGNTYATDCRIYDGWWDRNK